MRTSMDQQAIERLEKLIGGGEVLLDDLVFDSEEPGYYVNPDNFVAWKVSSLAFLANYLGKDHVYTDSFDEVTSGGEWKTATTIRGLNVLRALKADIEAGYLTTVRELIHANLFSDFLEMAEYLASEGYKDPAAVLVGGVLEEHLRQLCTKHGIETEIQTSGGARPKKADAMNVDLAKRHVYSLLEQKQVTAWLDLRNKAAHGKYAEYSQEQVSLFLQGMRDFLLRHPA